MGDRTALDELRLSLSVLADRRIRRIEAALLLTELSTPTYATALFVYAFAEGGAAAVGLIGLAALLPSALAAPLAGVLADRGRRSRVAALAAAARSLLLAVTALVMLLGLPLGVIGLVAALASIPARVFRPAQVALLPRLTRSDAELARTIALGSAIENLGCVAGPALAGAMLLAADPPTVIVVCAAAMAGAALSAARVDEPCPATTAEAITERGGVIADVVAGWRVIAREPTLRLVITVYGFQTAVYGVLSVAIVELALAELGAGEGGVGLLNAALGVGGIVGGALALAVCARLTNTPALRLGTLLWGLPLVLVAASPSLTLAFVMLTVVGIGNVLVDVSSFALIQHATSDEFRGRVFGALEGVAVGSVALGSLVGGLFIEYVGVSITLCAAGCSLLAVAAGTRQQAAPRRDSAPSLGDAPSGAARTAGAVADPRAGG